MNAEHLAFEDIYTRHDYYQPAYRVDFWRRFDAPPGSDPDMMGYKQDSYRLTGAKSVREVRVWAEANADGRQFVIWIELPPDNDRTIARVEGVDPTNPNKAHLAE